MAIRQLQLERFTAFEKARFDFAPGINVLIGENATGKTHVLKALYAMTVARHERLPGTRRGLRTHSVEDRSALFTDVFRPGRLSGPHALVRKRARDARITLVGRRAHTKSIALLGGQAATLNSNDPGPHSPVFLPSREILSVFTGFAEANRTRELDFDRTFLDLADALNRAPLKADALDRVSPLLKEIERSLGGRERKAESRFVIKFGRDEFEAHLVAEGLRKLAQLARLVRNGSIAPGTLLLWDEPEANLNPVLVRRVVELLVALAQHGVQVVLTTHDYLLSQTLSLHAEYPTATTPEMQFFSLVARGGEGVSVEQSSTLVGLESNPILREYARQYDVEQAMADREGDK